ncbi:MAG: ATP-grasp domain-containing protein [Candidatus Hodarchaeota archaeon]
MSKKKIFLFEFASGGGFNQVNIPTSLFCEGFGMLRSIIEDFKSLDFEISILLDYRGISYKKFLQADIIKQVNANDDYLVKFEKEVKNCEFCFLIAPEFSDILYKLTKIVKNNNKEILSEDLDGITLGTYKLDTYEFFKTFKANTPLSFLISRKKQNFNANSIIQKFNQLTCPVIIKPEDGVGAGNIFYFENEKQIREFFKDLTEKLDINRNYILQEFIEGRDLSVSLIGTSSNPIILSVNTQNLNIKNHNGESEYLGGTTPAENYEEITKNLVKILENMDLSKFSSYYGIDFIRKKDKSIYFIEINPRLTTSYIGIRNIVDKNLAELIWDTKMKSLSSSEIHFRNFSQFSRIELDYNGNKTAIEIKEEIIPKLVKEIPELVTPPISFNNSNQNRNIRYSCFIATKEKNYESSRIRLTKIMETFKKLDFYSINL